MKKTVFISLFPFKFFNARLIKYGLRCRYLHASFIRGRHQIGIGQGKFVGVAVRGNDGKWRFQVDGYSGLKPPEKNKCINIVSALCKSNFVLLISYKITPFSHLFACINRNVLLAL